MKIFRIILLASGIVAIFTPAVIESSTNLPVPYWLAFLGYALMFSSAALNWLPNAQRKKKEDFFKSQMQNLIEMLQSSDPDKRLEASEQLRVLPSISPGALNALELATKDENPDVANIAQLAILENQIKRLENHKNRLEKSVPRSTMIVVAIGSFATIFSCVIGIAGASTFIGPSLSEEISERPILMVGYIFIALILTVPAVIYFRDNSKQKDAEALELTNKEIQELKKKFQKIEKAKPAT